MLPIIFSIFSAKNIDLLPYFLSLTDYLYININLYMEQKQYKRQSRQLSPDVKNKISQSLKNRPKSSAHAAAISAGLKTYWMGVEDRPTTDNDSSVL